MPRPMVRPRPMVSPRPGQTIRTARAIRVARTPELAPGAPLQGRTGMILGCPGKDPGTRLDRTEGHGAVTDGLEEATWGGLVTSNEYPLRRHSRTPEWGRTLHSGITSKETFSRRTGWNNAQNRHRGCPTVGVHGPVQLPTCEALRPTRPRRGLRTATRGMTFPGARRTRTARTPRSVRPARQEAATAMTLPRLATPPRLSRPTPHRSASQ